MAWIKYMDRITIDRVEYDKENKILDVYFWRTKWICKWQSGDDYQREVNILFKISLPKYCNKSTTYKNFQRNLYVTAMNGKTFTDGSGWRQRELPSFAYKRSYSNYREIRTYLRVGKKYYKSPNPVTEILSDLSSVRIVN